MRSSTSNSEQRRAFLAALFLLFSLPVILLWWGFGLPCQYEDSFLGELKYKVQRLEQTEGKRIILLGGSGVAFGADTALMEQELDDRSVVNFGLYAALGTTVMMDLSLDHLREGDIVILIPEQQSQPLSGWFDPHIMWQGVDGAYKLLTDLPSEKQKQMLGAFPSFAAGKFSRWLSGELPEPQGIYQRNSFDSRGDLRGDGREGNTMSGGWDPQMPIRFDKEMLSPDFLQAVREYAAAAKEKGAEVWYGFCPMNRSAVEDESQMDGFYQYLQEQLELPLTGDPHSFLLDAGWFYDTNFHTNASGQQVYTRQLIRAIKAQLGDSSPTEVQLPVMPPMVEAVYLHGDDRDEASVLCEEQNGTMMVIGVTGEGLTKERLIIPTYWQGLPVTAIGAEAFREAESLKEIVIQSNIQSIADRAFGDCRQLRSIHLEQMEPARCRVGAGLLEGTDAAVYVPSQSFSDYCIDYFWSSHRDALRTGEYQEIR